MSIDARLKRLEGKRGGAGWCVCPGVRLTWPDGSEVPAFTDGPAVTPSPEAPGGVCSVCGRPVRVVALQWGDLAAEPER